VVVPIELYADEQADNVAAEIAAMAAADDEENDDDDDVDEEECCPDPDDDEVEVFTEDESNRGHLNVTRSPNVDVDDEGDDVKELDEGSPDEDDGPAAAADTAAASICCC